MDKERIQRQLKREADEEERQILEASKAGQREFQPSLESSSNTQITSQSMSTRSGLFNSQYPFKWIDMFKNAAFGGTIGAVTGSVFGFMDGMRTVQQSEVLMNASNMAKGRYLMQGTSRSAVIFGTFFGGFHILRYGIRVVADPGEWGEMGMAGAVSLGALVSQPKFRPSMPYASMLIFMDSIHIIMRQFDD